MDIVNCWRNISLGLEFYQDNGYEYIDLPWLAPKRAVRHTWGGTSGVVDNNKYLIGSAEQSFISVWDSIEYDKDYVSCTPCFRLNDPISYTHRKNFMKVELFKKVKTIRSIPYAFIDDARFFFKEISKGDIEEVYRENENSVDIELNGIEVGSYNLMKVGKREWQCGTGIAEPRFSIANGIVY